MELKELGHDIPLNRIRLRKKGYYGVSNILTDDQYLAPSLSHYDPEIAVQILDGSYMGFSTKSQPIF